MPGILLSDLTNFMKAYPSGRIELGTDTRLNIALYDLLAARVNKEAFKAGTNHEFLIRTSQPYNAMAFGENVDLPTPGTTAYSKATIGIKELIATAGVSKQAMDFATGNNDAAWGNVVANALDMMKIDWRNMLSAAAIGDGTGKLARVVSESMSTISAISEGATYLYQHVLTCDNTYADFGMENTTMLKVGMHVDVLDANSSPAFATIISNAVVTAVSPGLRANGVATTGTVTIVGTEGLAVSGAIENDDIIVLRRGTKATEGTYTYPMGLTGLIGDDTNFGAYTSTFQGLTRASYPSLLSTIYDATDFATGGAKGTPDIWDLSVISDAINDNYNRSGKSIDALLMNSSLALAFSRLNKSNDIVVNTGSVSGAYAMAAAGAQISKSFIGPTGQVIPIYCDPNIAPNMLFGLCTDDLQMFAKGDFDFLREYGEIWEPARDSRKTNYEAPYGGYVNFGAYRCDTSFAILDLKTNVS